MPAPIPKSMPLTCILVVYELQMRAGGLDENHAEDLAKVLKRGKHLPRVQVVKIAATEEGKHEGLYCVGGFHTLHAHELAGRKNVPVSVREGTWEDALFQAATSNQGKLHQALKPKLVDRHRAVEMLLMGRSTWSDRAIGESLNVDGKTVGKIREEMEREAKIKHSEVREGADGVTQPIAKKPASAKKAAAKTLADDDGVAHGDDPKPAKFDWKSVDLSIGIAFRNLHGMAKFHGCEKNLKWLGIDRLMREVGEAVRGLKDELKKQK